MAKKRKKSYWRSRSGVKGAGTRPTVVDRTCDQEFQVFRREQALRRERQKELAKRVNARAIEESVRKRAPMRSVKDGAAD